MRTAFVFAALATLATRVAGQSVEFFYTDTINLCSFNGGSIPANGQTTHGGVCAYRTDTGRVYGCPAPDPTCWTYYQGCVNGGSSQQITCNENGAIWCCAADETCTTTPSQINVCIGNFSSPNSGVSIADANAKYLAALGVSNVTATSQTVDPTPFSTRVLATKSTSTTASITSSMTSSIISSSSSPLSSMSPTSTASTSGSRSSSTSSGSNAADGSSKSSGISGGAIAGIVIGAVALIGIVGAIFFYLGRRNKTQKQNQNAHQPLASEMGTSGSLQQNSDGSAAPGASYMEKRSDIYSDHSASELGTQGQSRVEMGGSEWRPSVRHEMA